MPSSSPNGKKWIGQCLSRIRNRTQTTRILDIGAGQGTYVRRYRSTFPNSHWTAVEVWTDYIDRFKLGDLYDQVINQDARTLGPDQLAADLVFAGDVLEHMTQPEAVALVDQILAHSKALIISIPIVHMPQGAHEGNPFEAHVKDDWSDQEVLSAFSGIIDHAVDQEIGVYLLSQDPEFIKAYQRLKIAIYTIAKDEQQHVDRWAASNGQADLRLVCDTGSTDHTVDQLEKHGVRVVPILVDPWRFDVARAAALNLLPADVDICIWQDLDEELLPGWREQLENIWQPDATIVNHRYRNNGRPWQWHSKIHARHDCHWTGAVHETLAWARPEKALWAPEIYLDEHQDVTKSRRSYLPLLERKVEEGDRDWRTYYFLANEYEVAGRMEQSITTRIKSYEALDENDSVVRSYVATAIARSYAKQADHRQARRWFQTAADHSAERETFFAWTEYCYNQKDWGACYLAARQCLDIQTRRDGFTYDERAWGWSGYDMAALAAHNLGIRKDAVTWGQQALELNPNDTRLKTNLAFYQGDNNG